MQPCVIPLKPSQLISTKKVFVGGTSTNPSCAVARTRPLAEIATRTRQTGQRCRRNMRTPPTYSTRPIISPALNPGKAESSPLLPSQRPLYFLSKGLLRREQRSLPIWCGAYRLYRDGYPVLSFLGFKRSIHGGIPGEALWASSFIKVNGRQARADIEERCFSRPARRRRKA